MQKCLAQDLAYSRTSIAITIFIINPIAYWFNYHYPLSKFVFKSFDSNFYFTRHTSILINTPSFTF